MEGENGFTRSIIAEVHSLDIKGDQMEAECGVTLSSLMKFILRISKVIKWEVKMV